MNQGNFQIINTLIIQNKGRLNLHQLQNKFGNRLTSKMLRKYQISSSRFLNKYRSLQNKYMRSLPSSSNDQWVEAERKLFIWLSILYCNDKNKNYDDLQESDWQTLSSLFFGKNTLLLKYQTKQIQRNSFRARWTKKEESILDQQIRTGNIGLWNDISRRIFFDTNGKHYKNSKQCRQHWFNHLDKKKKKGGWSKRQDLILLESFISEGRKWSAISRILKNRRTQHMVKNRFNSLVKAYQKQKQKQVKSEENIIIDLINKLKQEVGNNQSKQQHQIIQIGENQQILSEQKNESAYSDEQNSQQIQSEQSDSHHSNNQELQQPIHEQNERVQYSSQMMVQNNNPPFIMVIPQFAQQPNYWPQSMSTWPNGHHWMDPQSLPYLFQQNPMNFHYYI